MALTQTLIVNTAVLTHLDNMKKEFISKSLKGALFNLADLELYNSHLYKYVANWCQMMGYFGAQKHFLKESAEEIEHYQHVVDFLNDGGVLLDLGQVDAPTEKFTNLETVLMAAYEQEIYTEKQYAALAAKAMQEDHVVYEFALRVLKHQRKSVGEYGDLIARYTLVKDDACGILIIDKELGA
jgi:ferritin